MKKKLFVGAVLGVLVLFVLILFIDMNKLNPVDRYLLKYRSEIGTNHSYKGNDTDINIEIMDVEIYTKENILLQNQYNVDYFRDRCFPDVAYNYAYVDYDKMQVDFPVFKQYLDSYKTEGFSSESEYESFLDEHLEDYTTYMELDTKYVFITLYVSNESDLDKVCYLTKNQILFVNDSNNFVFMSDLFYCDDDSEILDENKRSLYFGHVKLNPNESKKITIGFLCQLYPPLDYEFSDNDKIYMIWPPDNVDYDPRTCEKRIYLNDFIN